MIGSRPALTLIAFLSLAVAACSSSPAAPTNAPGVTTAPATSGPGATQPPAGATQPPTATVDPGGGTSDLPCAAMEADVIAAAGNTLATREFTTGACTYNFGDAAGVPGLGGVVSVRLELPGSTDMSSMKLAFPDGDDVSGLGDAAYWAKSVNVMYAAFKGNIYAVQLVLFDVTKDQKVIAGTIMEALLSRI